MASRKNTASPKYISTWSAFCDVSIIATKHLKSCLVGWVQLRFSRNKLRWDDKSNAGQKRSNLVINPSYFRLSGWTIVGQLQIDSRIHNPRSYNTGCFPAFLLPPRRTTCNCPLDIVQPIIANYYLQALWNKKNMVAGSALVCCKNTSRICLLLLILWFWSSSCLLPPRSTTCIAKPTIANYLVNYILWIILWIIYFELSCELYILNYLVK